MLEAQEELPPPRRPMVYHVMVESHSPKASMVRDLESVQIHESAKNLRALTPP